MGCSKNLVDSESLIGMLSKKGYECHHDDDNPQGEYVVINTCGFIGDAKEESINAILELTKAKENGQIGKLFVMGCLSERYLDDLEESIPEVDKYYGKFNWKALAEDLPELPVSGNTQKTKAGHSCYIKISEGCDRKCAYCAIPLITGRHKSRSMEDILHEVTEKARMGVKEFNIIAQELTYYGLDLYGERKLPELIDKMADIDGVEWIRLHYAYPDGFPIDLLRVMRDRKNVCKYLDIALQHISTTVLGRMRRNITKEETRDFIAMLRQQVPGITLRTTLMVGFPGETEEEFKELTDFVKCVRFERMGAFAYSEEEGTYGAKHYKDDVPDEVKQQRLDKLMRIQQRISAEIMEQQVGTTKKVIIDRKEGDWYIARAEDSSPEVDPEILIPATKERNVRVGCFYDVLITGAEEFDLYGTIKK